MRSGFLYVLAISYFALAIIAAGQSTADEWNKKGNDLLYQGNYKEAVQAYGNALSIDSSLSGTWYNKGEAFRAQSMHREAIECYDEAISLKPKYENAWIEKGRSHSAIGEIQKAIESFDKALEINPHSGITLCEKGNYLEDLGEHEEAINYWKKAEDCLDSYDSINTPDEYKWNLKGELFSVLGMYVDAEVYNKEAESCFYKSHEINSNYCSPLVGIAGIRIEQGNYEDAINYCEQTLNLDPHNEDAFYNKGMAYYYLKNFGSAIESYKQAIAVNPSNLRAWRGLAKAYRKLGQDSDALSALEEVNKLRENYRKCKLSTSLSSLSPHDGSSLESWLPAELVRVKTSLNGDGKVKTLDLEEEYLPVVLASENPNAAFESLKAQAIASRSYALYQETIEKSCGEDCDLEDGQNYQVYNPAAFERLSLSKQAEIMDAVEVTEGLVLKYSGDIICAFYVDGITHTEFTNNEGKSGDKIEKSSQGSFSNPHNRGGMGQTQANDLANEGHTCDQILKHFYGSDIEISCDIYSNSNPEMNTGGTRWV